MPDFERIIDSARIYFAPSVSSREWARGYAKGKSDARKQVALVVLIAALGWILANA